jgi:CheY-like chemotaxis protein
VAESILIVDDNAMNVKLLRVILEREGYAVYTAMDGEEGLGVVANVKPRLILMDIRLPGIDGLELTRLLRADVATKDIVIVALTASGTTGDEQQALAAGCNGYLAKPIDVGALPTLIARYLAMHIPPH